MPEKMFIECKNISLNYELHYDKGTTLKEAFINFLTRKHKLKEKSIFPALSDVNFRVDEGERLAIIGKNGAGKSSLLKVISGILRPSNGAVHLKGSVQPLIEIGAGFNPEFSGRENIFLNGYMLGFSHKTIVSSVDEIIEFSGIEEFIDVPVKYYSSGMAVRLAFSIATSINPQILVFDEMLSAGDADFLKRAKSRISSLIDQAKLMIIVSHDLDLVKDIATRTLLLDKGKIIFDGNTPEALRIYSGLSGHLLAEPEVELTLDKNKFPEANQAQTIVCSANLKNLSVDLSPTACVELIRSNGEVLNTIHIDIGQDFESILKLKFSLQFSSLPAGFYFVTLKTKYVVANQLREVCSKQELLIEELEKRPVPQIQVKDLTHGM